MSDSSCLALFCNLVLWWDHGSQAVPGPMLPPPVPSLLSWMATSVRRLRRWASANKSQSPFDLSPSVLLAGIVRCCCGCLLCLLCPALPGFECDQSDRWDAVELFTAFSLGDVTARVEAERKRDPTDRGARRTEAVLVLRTFLFFSLFSPGALVLVLAPRCVCVCVLLLRHHNQACAAPHHT